MLRGALAAAAAAIACLIAPVAAHAAGVTTHAFMADRAIDSVTTPELADLLRENRQALLSGAAYPDSGYAASSFPGGDFGEITHWERFVNAYAAHVRAKREAGACPPLPGDCRDMVAHLMGVAAHGMGDELWDWMFEPLVADHGERPDHHFFESGLPGAAELRKVPPGSLINTVEYAMDVIAIVDHFRWLEVPLFTPPADDLVQVYGSIGRGDVRREGIAAGHALISAALVGERTGAPVESERIRGQMPWSSANFYRESGGVLFSARAIAGYYEAVWRKLVGSHPAPRVVGIHPEDDEREVTWEWQPVQASPGPVRGGGDRRIVAVLSNSVDAASVTPETFRLLGPGSREVPPAAGFPKAGPYHTGDGTHSIIFYPATDLEPCTRYRAVIETGLRDHAGARPEQRFVWSFVTRPRAEGAGSGPRRAVRPPAPADAPAPHPARRRGAGRCS